MRSLSRRQFLRGSIVLAGLTVSAACASPPTPTQRAPVHRIGYLASGPPNSETWPAFQATMREHGYVEGQNLVIEYRYATGDVTVIDAAAELIGLRPEVIVVPSVTDARAARAATTAIPIVSAGNGDLTASGIVASQGRPGGNVTGLTTPLLAGKHLEVLRETVLTLSRVAVLFDPATFDPRVQGVTYEAVGRDLGLQLQFLGAESAGDLESAFDAAVREHADGLYVLLGPVLGGNLDRTSELALQSRLPSMWQSTLGVGRGGLMGYGPDRIDLARRSAGYVDKILRGAQPADLPVEQPTKFDFVINLKTAQMLRLTIPPSILQQATEVIQ